MAATIRLMRFGKKGQPFYRIVVLDKTRKRDGKYIELLGTYNPMTQPSTIELKEDRLKYWQSVGAIPSTGFSRLMWKKPEAK